jgi:hypothetical protein
MMLIETIERVIFTYEIDFGVPPAFVLIGHQNEQKVLSEWRECHPFSGPDTLVGAQIMGVPICISSMNTSGVLAIDGNVWAHMAASGMLK